MATPSKPADNHRSAPHQSDHKPAPPAQHQPDHKHDQPDHKPEPRKPSARHGAPPVVAPRFAVLTDAASLFKNGHRIAKEGDPPEKWITMGRLGDGTAVYQMPMTPEIEQEIRSGQYYLAEGLEGEEAEPPPAGPPVVVDVPHAQGTATVGSTLTCTQGNWTNVPTNKTYQWLHDGAPITGATAAAYTILAADVGGMISCEVTAVNAAGQATSISNEIGPVA